MSGGTNMHLSRILYAAALGTTPSSQHWIMHPRRHACFPYNSTTTFVKIMVNGSGPPFLNGGERRDMV
ncbi:hypothetical protein DY000_02021469 [Brassica cretica]|uniref:Uncharacterized protein n=1 Tax=Brassica cretica TaxID=69181 RepID=A0ABQ7EED5_BRACR|nr:hypothetical protein DY000_02021469 [Brassica cretica]